MDEPLSDSLNPDAAETAVLSAAYGNGEWTRTLKLDPTMFHDPRKGQLWACLQQLHAENIRPDPAIIMERLGLSGDRAKSLSVLLVEIATSGTVQANAPAHADTIRDRATRRRMLAAVDGARQRLADTTVPLDSAVAYVERELVGSGSGQDREAEQLMAYDEFVGQDLPPVEWVIPDLLAREDRLVLTGTEGAGKTTLMRTVAVMVASGLHPFTLRSMDPRRVLFVDCENPNRIMVQRFAELGRIATTRGRKPSGLFIRRFPQGIDLGRPEQRMQLRYMCQAVQPDMLVIGPAYKMYIGGSNSREEDLARIVAQALDALREEFGFALILEHHIAKGEQGRDRGVAPIGSSLWMRWPEFGLGLKLEDGSDFANRTAKLVHWRGPRDERPWPSTLESGGPGNLPWIDRRSLARTA